MSFIDFENVKKEYTAGDVTIHAVQNCSFSIEKGELVVILGPSGAGKTTILNLLGGMDSPSGGGIVVDNSNVHQYGKKELINRKKKRVLVSSPVLSFFFILQHIQIRSIAGFAD